MGEEDYAVRAAREYFGEFGVASEVERLAAIIRKHVAGYLDEHFPVPDRLKNRRDSFN